jgi:hypothetical protein
MITKHVLCDSDDNEKVVEINFDYIAPTKASYDSEGMKLEPDTDGYVDINEVLDANGNVIELGKDDKEQAEDACWDAIHQAVEDRMIDEYGF